MHGSGSGSRSNLDIKITDFCAVPEEQGRTYSSPGQTSFLLPIDDILLTESIALHLGCPKHEADGS